MSAKTMRALSACLLLVPAPVRAQTPHPAPGGTEVAYRTLLALIDEMVQSGLVTRARADMLIARAQAQGGRPQVADVPPRGTDAAPPQALAQRSGSQPEAKSGQAAPVAAGPVSIASGQPDLPADLKVDWSRGAPVFASRDGSFSFKPRGRILADVSATDGSRYDLRDITVSTLRQFRFGAQGTIGSHLFYQFEADFRRNQTEVNNTFVGYRTRLDEVDLDIRAGSLLTDRGIDVATPAQANPFITLNVNSLAVAPQGGIFIMGASLRGGGPDWHATLAVHGDQIDGDFTRSDNRIWMARAHWNPWSTKAGAVHVGGWFYDEALPGRDATLAIAPLVAGALNGNFRVQSAALTGVDGSRGFGLELGAFVGPFYGYGEYGERRLRGGPNAGFPDGTVKALSVSGGWWITGEKVPYQTRSGTFIAPMVLRPAMGGRNGGLGGVELVARYEDVDLSDLPLGGTGNAITFGVNWHLTNYFRLMADYSHSRTDNLTGAFRDRDAADTVAARAEVSF